MAIKFLSGLNLSDVTAGSILKLDSNGNIVAATAGTDYATSNLWSTASNDNIYYNSGGVRIGTYQASVDAAAQLHVFDYQTTDPKLLIEDGNTGDASMQFKISTQSYTMGIDNSDSDKFILAASSALGTTNAIEVSTTGVTQFGNDIKLSNGWTLTTASTSYAKFGSWVNVEGTGLYTFSDILMDLDDSSSRFVIRGVGNTEHFIANTATSKISIPTWSFEANDITQTASGDNWSSTTSTEYNQTGIKLSRTGSGYVSAAPKKLIGSFTASVSFKTSNCTHLGIIFAASETNQDNDNYGVILRNNGSNGTEVRVQKRVSGGQSYPIGATNVTSDCDDGDWHELTVSYNGKHIVVDIDGTNYFNQAWTDTSFTSPGLVGLAIYDNTCQFNDFQVTEIPSTTTSHELRIQPKHSNGTPPSLYLGDLNNQYQSGMSSGGHLTFRSTSSMYFQTGGSNYRMIINSSGNVGIGTNSPSAQLQIDTPAANQAGQGLRLNRPSAGTNYHSVEFATNGTVDWSVGQNSNDAFEVYENGAAATTRFTIKEGGNVGIGTTSPAYKLDVNGSLHSTNITVADGMYHEGDSNTYINFLTDTIQMSTGGVVRTYINSSGNVGIGTSSPSYKLHVNGSLGVKPLNYKFIVGTNQQDSYSYGTMSANMPLNGYLWHDLLAFDRHYTRTQEVSSDGSTWSSVSLQTALFNQKQDQSIEVISSSNQAVRWTFQGVAWALPDFLNLAFTYASPSNNKTVLVESSADGSTWTTRHTSTVSGGISTKTCYISSYGGENYLRVTVAKATSNTDIVRMSSLKLMTSRAGDQGQGSEYQYPYSWDSQRNMAIGTNSVDSNFALNVGSNTKISSTGISSKATLEINNTSSSTFNHSINAFAPNLASGENNIFIIGRAGSTKNSGYIGYKYSSAGSNANVLTFGHWASDNLMNLTGDGNLGIGTTSPTSKLEVRATTATHQLVSINRANSDVAALYLGNNSSNDAIISGNNAPISLGKDVSGTYTEYVNIATDGELKFSAYGEGILKTNSAGIVSLDTNTYLTSVSVDWNDIGSVQDSIDLNSTVQIGQGDTETIVSFQNSGTERGRFEVDDSANSYFVATGFKTSTASTGFLKADGTVDTNTYSTATGVANNADVTPSWVPATDPAYATTDYVDTELTGLASESWANTNLVNVTGDTMTGALDIELSTSSPLLNLYNTSNSSGAAIQFSDQTSQSQTGNITFRHTDGQSQGGGVSFHFTSNQPDVVLVVGDTTNKGRFIAWSANSTAEVDYGFADDRDTGMVQTSADNVSLVAGGVRGVGVGSTAVSLKYAGTTKLATSTSGIDVTGVLDVSSRVKAGGQISVNNRTAMSVLHWSSSGSSTGAIKITLPGSHGSNWSMIVLRITAYEYNSTAHTVYYVSGHDWTSGWYNNGVTKIGNGNKDIQLAYDSNKDYVILGGTSSTWSYGHVTVDVMAHPSFYSSNMDISSGWAITQTTDLTGITTQSVTNKRVLTTSDEGSGNGIDADTVDGLQASSFLRSDATDTATGNLTFSGAVSFTSSSLHLSGHYYQKFHSGTTNYIHFYPNQHTGNASITYMRAWTGSSFRALKIQGDSNNITWGSHTLWTSGNDGSGSGLDADQLDGKHASDFVAVTGDDMSGRLTISRSATIGGSNLANSYLLLGTTSAGLGLDSNEIASTGDHLYIGTINAKDIFFRTNGSDKKMTIKSDGKVGIGTATPGGLLHLEGNFESGKALVIKGTYGTDTEYYFRTHGTNSEYLALYAGGTRVINFNSGKLQTYQGLDVLGGEIGTNSSSHLVIGSSVQIGQGDEDPVIEFKYGTTSLGKIDQFGDIHAGGFKVSGTTGFLKSDGSVDTTSYQAAGNYLTSISSSDVTGALGYRPASGAYGAWSSITNGSSGDWFPLFVMDDGGDGSALVIFKTYAHDSVIFTVSRGYNGSNQNTISVLNSVNTPNSGYATVQALRVRNNGWVEAQLVWSSGPTVQASIQVITGDDNEVSIESDLETTQQTATVNHTVNVNARGLLHGYTISSTGNITSGGRLYITTADANTTSTTALVLNGTEVEKRTLGSNAFTSYTDHSTQGYLTSYTETSTIGQVLTRGNSTNNTIHIYHTDRAYTFQTDTTWGGWARTPFYFEDGSGNGFGGLGAYGGNGTTLSKYYIGSAYNSNIIEFHTDNSVVMSGDLTLPDKIIHSSDTDTYIKFDANRIRLVAGNVTKFDSDTIYTGTVQSVTGTGTVSGLSLSDDGDSVDPTLTLSGTISISSANITDVAANADATPSWVPATNPNYLTSYTETDTLASVTGRGASTTTSLSIRNLTSRTILPEADRTYDLGGEETRWRVVFCETLDSAGQHESNLQDEEQPISQYATGTVLSWKDGKNRPCTQYADHMRMGIAVEGQDSPLIQGAEPVLVTGVVEEGDYLITSEKEGHAVAVPRNIVKEQMLFDCVIGKALESGDGDSHLIKTWINI